MEPNGSGEFDSPIDKGDQGMRLQPPEQNEGLTNLVSTRYKQAKSFAAPYCASDDRYRRIFGGDQWSNKLRPSWKARPVYNYTRSNCLASIAAMTDNKPTVNVVANKQEWAKLADVATDGLHAVFDDNQMQAKFISVLTDGHQYGTYISKQWFDPKEDRIKISHIDKRYFLLSPGALEVDEAEYCLVAANRWIASLKREFNVPKDAKIPEGVWDEALTHRPVDTQSSSDKDGAYAFPDSGAVTALATQPSIDTSQIATLIEMWDRDEAGQVWVTWMANGYLLRRCPSPFKRGEPRTVEGVTVPGRFPFAKGLLFPVPSQFYGMGDVAQQESPQDAINRIEAMVLDIARMCSSPMLMVPRSSRISLKDISNRIGGFVVYDGDKPPFWAPPPGTPAWLFNIVQNTKLHMDNISGVHDAFRGQLPAGKISGIAIQSLQAASNGLIGLKTRMFECWLREVALQTLDLMKQFYQDKTLRVGNKYVEINKYVPQQGGEVKIENDISAADFDVEIGAGSSLPVDKGNRYDQSKELLQLAVISKKQMLRDSGKSEDAVVRIRKEAEEEQLKDAALQGKMQALAQPPPPPEADGGAVAAGGTAPDPSDPTQDKENLEKANEELGAEHGGSMPSDDELAALEAQMKQAG